MSQLFTSDDQNTGVSASVSVLPMNFLISFRMDYLDLLAVQRILKSLLQHHSSKASILLRSAFFIVQLSYPYMTTGKTIALTRLAKRLELAYSYPGCPLQLLGVEWHALPCWLALSIFWPLTLSGSLPASQALMTGMCPLLLHLGTALRALPHPPTPLSQARGGEGLPGAEL